MQCTEASSIWGAVQSTKASIEGLINNNTGVVHNHENIVCVIITGKITLKYFVL